MSTITPTTSASDLEALRGRLSGTLALPGEPGYERATPWNVAVPVAPRAVIAAASAGDVAETVRFAAAAGLRVAVQRTGHGALAIESDDVLLVHTAGLDELSIDPATRIARVGAGVIWQRLIDAAAPHGLAPLCGSSPAVGVAGFLTGGGVGPLVRTFGLSADWVRSFDVVTGDGELRRVTPEQGGELFWGLRGGKSTLGIVCAVELELPEVARVHGGAIFFDGADAAEVLRTWARWAPALPEHANTSLALLQLPPLPHVPPPLAGRLTVAVRFTSTRDATVCEPLLATMRAAATSLIDTIADIDYAAIGSVHMDPTDPMPAHETSAMLAELTDDAVAALLSAAGPGSGSPQAVVELRLLGGALARPGAHASAFCHRDAAFSLLAIGVLAPEIADAVLVHGAALESAMAPWATGRLMPNFAPASPAPRYDEDTRAWLIALGDRFDPAGVLRVGQVTRAAV